MNKTRTQRPHCRRQVLNFPRVEESTLFEDHIRARLRELTNLVRRSATFTLNLALIEQSPRREALEELIVKEVALRWIARAASHSTGTIREKLWAEIDLALTDLEKIGESLMHPDVEQLLLNSTDLPEAFGLN